MLTLDDIKILIDLNRILRTTEGQTAICRVRVVEAGKVDAVTRNRIHCVGASEECRNVLQRGVVRVRSVEPAEAELCDRRDRWIEFVRCAQQVSLVLNSATYIVLRVWRSEVTASLIGFVVVDVAEEHLSLLAEVVVHATGYVIGVLWNTAACVRRRLKAYYAKHREICRQVRIEEA